MLDTQFKYRVVFFKQPACPACNAMIPVWNEVAGQLADEYPHYNIGFGEWDVLQDNWSFADQIGVDGTPNFVVFDDEANVLGLNTDGMVPASQLKSFILNSIESN